MPKISLSGPADLLTILPFHLGFQPTRSVVVVCFHGKRLGLVARFDLVPAHLADASAAAGLPTLVRERPSSVCLVGFEDEAGESDALTQALRAGLEEARVVVRDRLIVRDGRWFTVDCDCCPPGGRLMPELADVPAVAGYVALGHSVLDDRDALVAVVRPLEDDDPQHGPVEAAVDTWQARYTVSVAIDRLAARGLLLDDAPRVVTELEGAGSDDVDDDLAEDVSDDLDDLDDLDEDLRDADEEQWGGGATVIDLETGRRRRAAAAWGDAPGGALGGEGGWADGVEDDVELTGSVIMQAESLAAWSAVLRGELGGEALVERVPALVGPLRDVIFRDALIAWLCPGAVPLSEFPPALVELLESFVGPDVRAAAAAESGPPQPRPRRGRRKRGRRLERRSGRGSVWRARSGHRGVESRVEPVHEFPHDESPRDEPPHPEPARGEPARDDKPGWDEPGRDAEQWQDWREWDEASAPHHVQARLESVCRATPAAHAAPLLALVANYAWWRGDGARAGVAADTALDLEPDHRLSRLIRESLDVGLRGGGAGSPHADLGQRPHSSGSWNSPSSA